MGQKLVIGPINRGLRNDVTPFNIDNDSFPTLINAYQWRGRLKRKRGTSLLGRLTRVLPEASIGVSGASPWTVNIFSTIGVKGSITGITNANPGAVTTLDPHNLSTGDQVIISDVVGMTQVNGQTFTITNTGANTFTIGTSTVAYGIYISGGIWSNAIQPNAQIEPGSVIITIQAGPDIVFTDQGDGTLTSPTPGNSGTINYLTGEIVLTHTAGAGVAAVATFAYFPELPVMGLEDFKTPGSEQIGCLAFDTKYSYIISTASPYSIYPTNFYKNPPIDATNLPGYVPKSTATEFTWNGEDYQQFWTVNYQNVLWATNGINVPFDTTHIGMQFKPIVTVTVTAGGPPAIATLEITGHGLVVGDFVFINEVVTTTGINFQTGYVVTVIDPNNVSVEFPFATIAGNGTGGIAQYLTSSADPTLDCIKWYDGDPTNGNVNNFMIDGQKGWVNFMPPLSRDVFSIDELPAAQYYLVGGRIIFPYKDRLLILGPVIQSSGGTPKYLPDAVIFSQNGTPFYTSSFTGDVSLASTVFHPVLVPDNMIATANAWFEDQTGYGGYIAAGIDAPILTCASNEDVLIVGFQHSQTRLVYTGNDILPFNFYLVSSEFGSSSTFSSINMGDSVLAHGEKGFIRTNQVTADRIDEEIPDEVFQIRLVDNGSERFCSQRDFINEWIYWTYPVNRENEAITKFPSQTLHYNYRTRAWAIFLESYTTYGTFRKRTGYTWSTIGDIYPTWGDWNDPWNAGSSTLLQPEVIAGNQQGFVMIREEGTAEGNSISIQSFSGNTVTSPSHNLNNGDFILISGALGTISQEVNGKVFSIYSVDEDTFKLKPSIGSGTYIGAGVLKKIYPPYIQSKQFPLAWDMGRKTRLGAQQYLLTTTDNSQMQLLIFLSQNADSAYNSSAVIPSINTTNSSLIYSTVLYTCPESTNLGLTPANTNLQMVTAQAQSQIWHRINTSLIGDTVQIGFTLSDSQLNSLTDTSEEISITGITLGFPTVVSAIGKFPDNELVKIEGVVGTTQMNYNPNTNNVYRVISSTDTDVTLDIDSTAFDAWVSGGTIRTVAPLNQFAEIEIHGFILDVSPSMVLA